MENSSGCWAASNAFIKAVGDLQVSGFMIIETQTMSFFMASLGQWEKSFLSPCLQETKVSPLHRQEENAPQDCDCSKPQQTQPIAETSHLRKCYQAALYNSQCLVQDVRLVLQAPGKMSLPGLGTLSQGLQAFVFVLFFNAVRKLCPRLLALLSSLTTLLC